MANVKFLRGLQANLPSGSSIQDGALYITTDSKRLFLGNGNELLPIAEGITTVTSVSVLPAAAQHQGEFYYVTDGNILAWSNGTTWLQTNVDTQLEAANDALSVNNGVVSFHAEDTHGNEVNGSFTVAAATNNVTIGQGANGELTIGVAPDTTYAVSTAADNNDVKINLTPSQNGTALASGDSFVKLVDSTSINVSREADGSIKFQVKEDGVSGIDDFTASNEATGFKWEISTGGGTDFPVTLDPTIVYGNSANQTVHFVNGVATLSVPTSAELTNAIDNLEKTINAMTYRGVASSAATITGSTLHNGDVWLADQEFTIGGKAVKPGYLVVVQGTETDGVIPSASATFDVVKGNDTDTTYAGSATTHGIVINNSDDDPVAQIALTAGTSIELTDTTSTNGNSIEVKHANVTRTDPTKGAETQSPSTNLVFDVVTGVTTNAQGHVTAVATKTVTVVDTQLDAGAWTTTSSVANNVATITHTNSGDLGTISLKLASTGSIAISGSDDTTTIDIVWGQF